MTAFCHPAYAASRCVRGPARLPSLVHAPVVAQIVEVLPEPDGEPGRVGGAERGRFGDDGADDRDAEHVGLQLHQGVVDRRAAVHLEHFEADAGVLHHRVQDGAGLEADRFERGAREVRLRVEPRQPDDGAARVRPPVGREEPGEGGHEIDAAVVGHRVGERFDLRGRRDDPELIAQPLHRRTGDRDRALEREDRLAAHPVAHRRQQPRLRRHDLRAGVEQHEVAGAVGVLRFTGADADLADGRGLLIAEVAGDGHFAADRTVAPRDAERRLVRRGLDRRQHRARDVEDPEQLVVPLQRRQVHQHRPARVGHVGGVDAAVPAAGQVPDDPRVGVAEHRLAASRRVAHARHVVEDPLDLRARKIGRRRKAGARADHLSLRLRQRVDDPIGPRVLPDDRVVPGLSGLRVPDDRRLALIGDADGGQVRRGDVGVAHRARDHLVGARRDLQRIVLDPAGLRQDLLVLELMAGDLVAPLVEHHEAGARRPLVDRSDVTWHL